MSFCLGGLGHSLERVDGSVASFTHHISHSTKDVLREGTEKGEEVPDSTTKESEVSQATLKSENQRLKTLCSVLEEKYEASELHRKQQTASYRHRLQQKEAAMGLLKVRQLLLRDQLQKLQSVGQQLTPESPSLGYDNNHASAFQGDDMDFADLIWSQQEIIRLSNEVLRLEAEVSHWKRFAQTSAWGANSIKQSEICELQVTIRELERNQNTLMEDHQLQVAVLQNVYQQTLAEISRSYHEKVNGYEQRIKELENSLETGGSGIRRADESVIEDMPNTMVLMKGQLSKPQNEGDGINGKIEQDLKDEERACPFEDEQMDRTEELDVQNEESVHSKLAAAELHQSDQSQICNLNLQKENVEPKEQMKQKEKELSGVDKELAHSLSQDSNSHVKDDSLIEGEREVPKLQQNLSEMEQPNDNVKGVALDLKVENEKLVLALEDVRRQLEETTERKNSLEKKTAVRALKVEKGILKAKWRQAEKKLLEESERYDEQAMEELTNTCHLDKSISQVEHEPVMKLSQEKDDEIPQLKTSVEQMDAAHGETKEILSSALEEQKELTQLTEEENISIESFQGSSEFQEELEKYAEAVKENDILQQNVEEQEAVIASMTEENEYLRHELECLREESPTAPVADPQTLATITALKRVVCQLSVERRHLEDEVKQQQKTIEDQEQSRLQLLGCLREQKQQMKDFRYRLEQMNIKHAELLSEKDEEIQILQDTIGHMNTQMASKKPARSKRRFWCF